MPTPTKGPRLGGGPAHERLILANLATQLFANDKITTTQAKAKRLRPLAEESRAFYRDRVPGRGPDGPTENSHSIRSSRPPRWTTKV